MIGLLLAAVAATSAPYSCPEETTAELLACASGKFAQADARLNALWESMPHDPGLLKAQRAWLEYRDAMCEAENPATPDGSLYSVFKYLCWAELTNAQAARLQDIASR